MGRFFRLGQLQIKDPELATTKDHAEVAARAALGASVVCDQIVHAACCCFVVAVDCTHASWEGLLESSSVESLWSVGAVVSAMLYFEADATERTRANR